MEGLVAGQTRQGLLQFQQTDQCQRLPSGFYVSLAGDEDLLTWASLMPRVSGWWSWFAFQVSGWVSSKKSEKSGRDTSVTRPTDDFLYGGQKREGGLFICGLLLSRYPGA